VRTVALVDDLMDRSHLGAALPGVAFARDAAGCVGASAVVIDLHRYAGAVTEVRRAAPGARIIAFGSHVDTDALDQALEDGADAALPRSRFFRDPAAALHPE
jgi:hypothetical protein